MFGHIYEVAQAFSHDQRMLEKRNWGTNPMKRSRTPRRNFSSSQAGINNAENAEYRPQTFSRSPQELNHPSPPKEKRRSTSGALSPDQALNPHNTMVDSEHARIRPSPHSQKARGDNLALPISLSPKPHPDLMTLEEARLALRQEAHDAALGVEDARWWFEVGLVSVNSYTVREREL